MADLAQPLYLDLSTNSAGGRIVSSPRDPSGREFGPTLTAGDKVRWDVYLGYVIAQAFDPLNLPSGYTCSLLARRADGIGGPIIAPVNGTLRKGTDGYPCWRFDLDLPDEESLFAVPDADRSDDRIRLRCQMTISSGDSTEVFRLQWLSLLRPNIDPESE